MASSKRVENSTRYVIHLFLSSKKLAAFAQALTSVSSFFFSLKPRFHIYFLLRAEIRFKVLAELVEENAYESRQTSKGQPIVSLLMLKGTIT